MKQKLVYLLAACLLMLAACSDVTEISNIDDGHAGLLLRDGEQEVHLYLKGLGNGGGVPVTRASGLVTLPGESTVDEIVVYSLVNKNPEGTTFSIENGSDSYATLERCYHYKSGATGNDLVVTPDGDGYRISLGVLKDNYMRYFVMHANAGGVLTTTSAVEGTPKALVYLAAASTDDRTNVTTLSDLDYTPLPFPITWATESSVASPVLPPLPMSGTGYWTKELTGGYSREVKWVGKDDLNRGVTFRLERAVARFDISNLAATGFTVTGIAATGVRTNAGDASSYAFQEKALDNSELIAGALYLPRTRGNSSWGSDLALQIKGILYGIPTEVEVKPNQYMGIAPNTRYIINIVNTGSTLGTTLRVAEWDTGEDEMNSGDLFGTLNKGATMSLEVTKWRPGDVFGEYVEAPVTDENEALQYGELNADTKKITVVYNSGGTVYIKLTGTTGDTKPVGIVDSEGWLDWARKTEESSSGAYVVKLPVIVDAKTPVFTPPQTSALKVLTHPDGGKEQCDEYVIEKEWVTPTMANDSRVQGSVFPEITITTPNDKWNIDETTKTITLPIMAGYEALGLKDASLYSGWITTGLGDWLETFYTPRRGEYPTFTPSFIKIVPTDNFKSDKDRVSELVLREYKGTAVEYTTYKIIQPGGNFNASLLSNGGFGVNITGTVNGGELVEGLKYNLNRKSLECPFDAPSSNPIEYNISIHSTNSDPVFVEIIQGGSWMSLEKEIYRADGSTSGKYAVGLRVSENETGISRSGQIAVSYRDATTNALKTEIITVSQASGR